MISPQRMLLSSMKELSTSENGRRGGRGGGVGCSYLGGGGSSSMMNVGTGLIMISSSLATSAAVTTEGTSAGTGVSTGASIDLGRWNWRAGWDLHRGSNAGSLRADAPYQQVIRSLVYFAVDVESDDLAFSDIQIVEWFNARLEQSCWLAVVLCGWCRLKIKTAGGRRRSARCRGR